MTISDSTHGSDEVVLPWSCGGCSARWSGSRTAHCAASCHATFTSPTSFDAHRRDGQCRDPRSAGLVEHRRVGYAAWGRPGDDAAVERMQAAGRSGG